MESEDGCARAGRHAAITLAVRTSSSARSPLCPQASPGQRPHHRRTCSAAASPRQGGAALAPTSARRRGESHTRFIMTLLVAAKARNVHTARGAPARAGVGVARGRGQGWAGGCHRFPSNAFKCF